MSALDSRSLKKVKSSLSLSSPSGRSSPAPSRDRNTLPIKRPPSAARLFDSKRCSSPAPSDRGLIPNFKNSTESLSLPFRPSSSLSGRSSSQNNKGAENTTVSVRIRPAEQPRHSAWNCDTEGTIRSVSIASGQGGEFAFDNVFTDTDTNDIIYNSCVRKLIAAVVDGFHGTVFAYGMTGTGKTYSMQGVANSPGIILLAVQNIFELISQNTENIFTVKVSYLEIYNERIRDLLAVSEETEEIKLREDAKRGVHAFPLIEVGITSLAGFQEILDRGDRVRHSAATDFNAHSSRSHAVVQLILENTPAHAYTRGTGRVSTLNLIDLAGSEKAATDVERRKEGAYINKSLLTLGTVIARLTSTTVSNLSHIPFRDSKLTRLLQNALSGLSLVSILATINVDQKYLVETTNTLKFASRAKFIPSKAKRGDMVNGDPQMLIESLRAEVASLKAQLFEAHSQLAGWSGSISARAKSSLGMSMRGSLSASTIMLDDIHEDKTGLLQDLKAQVDRFERERELSEKEKEEQVTYISDLEGKYNRLMDQLHPPVAPPRTTLTLIPRSSSPSSASSPMFIKSPLSPSTRRKRTLDQNVFDQDENDRRERDRDRLLIEQTMQKSRHAAAQATASCAQLKEIQSKLGEMKKRSGYDGDLRRDMGILDESDMNLL